MKKSRIIVPAMAVIAFSTAASIAGSVAWFTASRQVTINGGSYAVVKTNSNLEVAVAAGVGTSLGAAERTIVFNDKLTDGSFNHNKPTELNPKGWSIYAPNSAGTAIEREIALVGNDDLATDLVRTTLDGGVKVYTAVTFKLTFTMKFGPESPERKDVGLFLNNTASQSEFTTTSSPVTATGFRMAFVPTNIQSGSEGKSKVFADLQTSGNCKYVSSTSDFTGTSYAAGDLIDISYNAALPTSSTERNVATARADYLGTFVAPTGAGSVSLEFTVVCWFEGTDPNIVDQASADDYQTVTAKLVFDAVDLKAAA